MVKTLVASAALAGLLVLTACDRPGTEAGRNEAGARPVQETPKRKPGLWKQTMLIEGVEGLQTMSLCLDADSDAKLAWWGQQGPRQECASSKVERQADGSWKFSSVCEAAGAVKMTASGSAVGDFDEKYQLQSVVTTTNSPIPQLNGSRNITIDASWEGPCPPGMQPGDADIPGGERINLLALSGAR